MACRLFGDNPLFESIMVYCQLDHKEQCGLSTHPGTGVDGASGRG